MNDHMVILGWTAASVGFVHTLLGPDHYLPFVAMSRARRWSTSKTVAITLSCGLGHVLSSIAIGAIGIALGAGVDQLSWLESARGRIAGWLLVAFGLIYFMWGVRRAMRNQPHTHTHVHVDGTVHAHEHTHAGQHLHVHHARAKSEIDVTLSADHDHIAGQAAPSLTPWILFTIFLFGPCEPLIPVVMYPAAIGSWLEVAIVTGIFAVVTLVTMTTIVLLIGAGVSATLMQRLERYSHALAGFVVLACGTAMTLGL